MAVHITQSNDNLTLKIHVDGAFDFHVHRQFRQAYMNNDQSVSHYIIDLSGTDYMDSCALGMLVLLHEHISPTQGRIEVINASQEIRRVLTIANLDRLVEIT